MNLEEIFYNQLEDNELFPLQLDGNLYFDATRFGKVINYSKRI